MILLDFDADNFNFGVVDREDANKAFNKVVTDISRSRSGEVDAGLLVKNIMILLKNMQMQK